MRNGKNNGKNNGKRACKEHVGNTRPFKRQRQRKPSVKFKDYQLDPLKPKSRGYFELAFLYDKNGQLYVESVDSKDDLNLVDLVVGRFDDVLSPPDVTSKLSENGSPIKETLTPRKRNFKHLLQVKVQVDESKSMLAFYQVPNSQEKLERHPPVYHDLSTLIPVTPPKQDRKTVSGRFTSETIRSNKRKARVNPSGFYRMNSANDLSQNGERNAHSHLLAVHQVGDFGREGTVAATEGQNITQMAFENAVDKALEKLKGKVSVLYASAEATLQRDATGQLTHVGKTQTVSYATSPGKHVEVKADFDSQNPNRATTRLSDSLKVIIFEGLSSDSSSGSSDEDHVPMELEERSIEAKRLDFSAS